MLKNKNQNQGFTLIELLVTIAIISLLVMIAVTAVKNAQRNARDSIRKNDLKTIQTALELYYQDNGFYPHDPLTAITFGHDGTCFELGADMATYLAPKYLNKIPNDPDENPTGVGGDNGAPWWDYASEKNCYGYISDGKRYSLTSNLENRKDPTINHYKDFGSLLYGDVFEANPYLSPGLMMIGN